MKVLWAEQDQVPADDRGLGYGDGLFETIRIEGERPVLLRQHMARLYRGALALGIPLEAGRAESITASAIARYRRETGWILKLVLTRGSGGRGYRPPEECKPRMICSAHELPPAVPAGGVAVRTGDFPLCVNPRLAGLKTLNRLEQVLASRALQGDEYEVVMPDMTGALVEGTRTNLMVRLDDGWQTPPVRSLAVAGVLREHVIKTLRGRGETVVEEPLAPSLFSSGKLRGLYLLNSVAGYVPVRSLDCRNLPLDDGLATICGPLEKLE